MQETGVRNQAHGADKFGLKGLKEIHWNLVDAPLYERAIAAGLAYAERRGFFFGAGAGCDTAGVTDASRS